MGVRPPDNDDDGPDAIEFGIASLDGTLSDADIEYPTDAQTISEEIGHVEIPYDGAGHSITIEAALAETDVTEFAHEQELLNALHPVFEAKREATGNSLLAQFRALLPF